MMYLLNGLPAFFGTINITGNIIISGQGLFAAGTNAAPSISFQSDPDTGVYLDAANTVGIATGGVGTVIFSSSAGIGKIKAHGTRVLALEAGTGNTNITLTPSGSGVVQSSAAFQTSDGTAAAPSIAFANSTNMGFFRYGPNDLGVSVLGATSFIIGSGGTLYGANGTARLTLPASGSVGLVAAGTSQNITLTPSGSGGVHVANTGANTPRLYIQTTNTATANGLLAFMGSAGTALLTFGTGQNIPGNQAFEWLAGANTTMALTNGGRLLLGTLNDSANGVLQLASSTATSGGIGFGTDTSLYRIATGELEIRSGPGVEALLSLSQNGTQRGYIRTNGGAVEFRSTTVNPLILSTNNLTALTLDASQNAAFVGTGVSTAGLTVNLGDQSKTRYALFGNSSNGAARCAVISQMRALNYDDTFFGRNLVAVPTTDAAKTLESSAYAGMLLRFDGNIDWVANVSSTAGASITPTVRMSLSNAGLLTMTGALRLNNAYVAGAVVGTGYITIQDSTGTTYRVPVLV